MEKCKIEGCENKIKSDGLCCKHYQQIQKFGKIKRTKFDPNEIILYEDFAELILYDENGNEKVRALIDLEDVEKIKQYKWKNWGVRSPLTLFLSSDNGKTFTKLLDLECGEGEFSYPSIIHKDGKIYIVYTYKREKVAFCEIDMCDLAR